VIKDRDEVIDDPINIQYVRSELDFKRGTFRVKGDVLEILPVSTFEDAVRVEFFGDEIDRIVNGRERISLFPFIMMAKHGTVEHKNGIPLQDKDRMDADLLLPAIFCIICQPLILNMTICIHILRLANQISCLS